MCSRSPACSCCIQNSSAWRPCLLVGGNAAQVAQAIVDVGNASVEVDFVEGKTGEFGARRQASLASQQTLLLSLAGKRVGEDLRDQLQSRHQCVRPVALGVQRVETQDSNGVVHPGREGKRQVRLDADQAAAFPVDGGRCRKRIQRRHGNAAAGQHFPRGPGELCLVQGSGRRHAIAGVDMGGGGDTGTRSDHCHSTARSMPRGSHTRRSASSISRSTSPGRRLMKPDESSETSVSSSRRCSTRTAEDCGSSIMDMLANDTGSPREAEALAQELARARQRNAAQRGDRHAADHGRSSPSCKATCSSAVSRPARASAATRPRYACSSASAGLRCSHCAL